MPLEIDSIKSAVVLTDPAEIEDLLVEVYDKAAKDAGRSLESALTRDDDGRVRIEKAISTSARREGAPPMPSADAMRDLAVSRGIAWKDEHAERVVPYWASDERVDSHGDIVRQNWFFGTFEKNPVLPFGHAWHLPPVGNAIDWSVVPRKSKDYKGDALHLLALFATADESEEADRVFRLVNAGFLRAGSVGFRSRRIIRVENEDERSKLGLGRWGVILDDNELLEFSPTTLGANAGALTVLSRAKSAGLVKASDIDTLREVERSVFHRTTGNADAWRERDGHWIQIARALFPSDTIEPHADFDEPFFETSPKDAGRPLPTRATVADEGTIERLDRIEGGLDALAFGLGSRIDGLGEKLDAVLMALGRTDGQPNGTDAETDAFLEALTSGDRAGRIRAALDARKKSGK